MARPRFFHLDRLVADAPAAAWRHRYLVGVALVAAMLLVEGFVLRRPYEPAPRDLDSSVRHLQTLALADSAFLRQSLPYRAQDIDPQRWYFPFVKPFVMRTRTGMQSIFPTVAAAIDVPVERLGGFAGIRLLSIVAILVAVVLTLRFLRSERDWLAPVALVLATPLWSYALGGTGHPVALALSTMAFMLAIGQDRAFAAGLLLGLSATLRDETLALAPGLALVCAWRWRRLAPLAWLVVGVMTPLVVVGLVDDGLYGRPAAAHLLHALRGTIFPDAPSGAMPVLRTMTWQERSDVVLIYWLDGRDRVHAALVVACVALAAVIRRRTGSYWGAVPALALVLFDTARDVLAMFASPQRLAALMRVAPFVVFAVLPHAADTPDRTARRNAALVISAVFVLVALLTTNTTGGKPLGPRLLLPIWLLLAGTAWQGIRGHLAAGRTVLSHRVLAAGGVALVLAGLVINVGRLMPLYRVVDADTEAATRYVAGAEEDVIVMGSPFAIDPVIAVYPMKAVMLASSAEDARDIARRLAERRVPRLLFVRRDDRGDLAAEFSPFGLGGERHFGRWVIQHWTQ